jgi:Dolichyl-phosphate-mannose-protein mannosyltransferase
MGVVEAAVVVGLCGLFLLLAVSHARTTSATYDETDHLSAGYSHLRWHDYRLNPELPPLVKLWAALWLVRQDVWPASIELHPVDLSRNASMSGLVRLKRLWAAALDAPVNSWVFANQLLFAVRDEALSRAQATQRWTLPSTTRLATRDFHNDAEALLFRARLSITAMGVLLGVLIFLWARALHGPPGGVVALALYAIDPSFIAHGSLVTTDVPVALFMFGAVFFLWRACRRLRVPDVGLAALACGLAFATKHSAVVLLPTLALLVLARVLVPAPWPVGLRGTRLLSTPLARAGAAGGILAVTLLASYVTVWAVYGFRYSAARDPARAALAEAWIGIRPEPGSRREPGHLPIEDTVRQTAAFEQPGQGGDPAPIDLTGRLLLFAQRHHLAPEAYLNGIAVARLTAYPRLAFLRGQYSDTGFRSYFLWTFLLKTPLVTLAAFAAAAWLAIGRGELWARGVVFLALPVAVYGGVAVLSAVNIGHRHLLPVYPFLYVLSGELGRLWARLGSRRRRAIGVVAAAAILASAAVVFAPPWRPALVYPHYLAYFNELAGGPRNGYRSLVDSNLDWGQDLKDLKRWLEARGVTEPVNLCYFGTADPLYYGISHVNLPGGYAFEPQLEFVRDPSGRLGIRGLRTPGYLAISVSNVVGINLPPAMLALWREILARARLVDVVGYSIFVYRLEDGL